MSYSSLEDYIECPFKYKLLHEINFSQSTVEYNKLKGLFVHNLFESINNRIKANNNQYIGDKEVINIFEKFKNSYRFENLKLTDDEYNVMKNDILYYYSKFGKFLTVLKTEQSFKISKEFYQLSGIVDLIYKTPNGKIGILDYKNTNIISYDYIKNYIKPLYTYVIDLNNSFEISELKIYAVKARKMIDVDFNQKSLDILLDEFDSVSQNIEKELFDCNVGEDCINCSFSNICIRTNKKGTSVFEFNKENLSEFKNKFYLQLPRYEITDSADIHQKNIILSEKVHDCDTDITENRIDSQNTFKNNKKSIKTPALHNYTTDYFKRLANELKKNPNFISDRDMMNHENEEFIPIDNAKDVNEKSRLKEKGKKLEKHDLESPVEFYDELKKHRLFINDYYPYRRQCIIYKNKLKDDLSDWKTIEALLMRKIYLNPHQLIWIENKILELKEKADLNSTDIKIMDNLLESYKIDRKKFKPYQNTPVPIAEKILKDKKGVRLLSEEKYNKTQNLFYVKELA